MLSLECAVVNGSKILLISLSYNAQLYIAAYLPFTSLGMTLYLMFCCDSAIAIASDGWFSATMLGR